MSRGVSILGISAFYHDAAAALVRDGTVVAAASEERFSRRKGDASFPVQAVQYCLREGGIRVEDLTCVGFYDKPLLKFERILESYVSIAPRGFRSFLKASPLWLTEKLYQDRAIRRALQWEGPLICAEHHESHAASAFFPSPFREAAILTVDGVGEWATASIGIGRDADIEILKEVHWPHSLGLFYSAFTYYLGFKVNSGEHKVMGLASYGEPKYVELIKTHLLDLKEDGSFQLNQRYFDYLGGLVMTSPAFDDLFGGPRRVPESTLAQRHKDIARSVQAVCEEVMLRLAHTARRETGLEDLCLAGGVALNCVVNARLLREGPFKRVWVQPAAGDAGGALGVALLAWHRECRGSRDLEDGRDGMRGAYLGPSYDASELERFLTSTRAVYDRLERDELLSRVATLLAHGQVIAWFNGRMEFGPRALGARSILADPRSPSMRNHLNAKIKFREAFRPFAPSVLVERAAEYFDLPIESPYMLFTAQVTKKRQAPSGAEERDLRGIESLNVVRSAIPAVTHVDCSARVQTVQRDSSPDFYDLLKEFETQTGCPVLVNTSFNLHGEPIVCTPSDAYHCFMRTSIDYLVLGPFLLDRAGQPKDAAARVPTAPAEVAVTPEEARVFGLAVGSVFVGLGAIGHLCEVGVYASILVGFGLSLVAGALVAPRYLHPLRRVWMDIGRAGSRVAAPILLGAAYFGVLFPVALLVRLHGRDRLHRSEHGESLWVSREPGHRRSDLNRQF